MSIGGSRIGVDLLTMSSDADLAALRAFLADFEQYLKSDTVFWTVSNDLPALTIGGLLFVRRSLSARRGQFSAVQAAAFNQLESQAEALFNQWPANIEKKALREISSRLNVWASAIEEGLDHPRAFAENYPHAVNTRVYLGLLLPLVSELAEGGAHRRRLSALDTKLRGVIIAGDFIWDSALAAAFPAGEFWFLHGHPKGPQSPPK